MLSPLALLKFMELVEKRGLELSTAHNPNFMYGKDGVTYALQLVLRDNVGHLKAGQIFEFVNGGWREHKWTP